MPHYTPVTCETIDEVGCPKCLIPVSGDSCPRCSSRDKGVESKNEEGKIERKPVKMVKTGNKVPKPILSGRKEFKTNPSKRLIGFEIEVGTYRDGDMVTAIAKKYGCGLGGDGSVPEGFEMQTAPANGDKMIAMIQDISHTIRKAGADATNRAGLHTHIDCRDLRYNCMRKVCILYGKTEAALYSIIDPRRMTGQYCRPMGGDYLVDMMSDPTTAKEELVRLVYGSGKNLRAAGRRSKEPVGGDRYLGLNLHSWWMRGTIEFRMHHGTTRWEKMINWGMLLAGMVDTASSRGDREIMDWPTGLEGMLAYAPTGAVKEWVKERWEYFASKRKKKDVPVLPQFQSRDIEDANEID